MYNSTMNTFTMYNSMMYNSTVGMKDSCGRKTCLWVQRMRCWTTKMLTMSPRHTPYGRRSSSTLKRVRHWRSLVFCSAEAGLAVPRVDVVRFESLVNLKIKPTTTTKEKKTLRLKQGEAAQCQPT
jgi:hypothetical protein